MVTLDPCAMCRTTSVFDAVSHIWSSLNEPRADYCTLIGISAGTGGKGKRGVVLALRKFLEAALETMSSIPPTADFSSLDEWHRASMLTFVQDEEDLDVLVRRYATALNCGIVTKVALPLEGVVVQGPWGSAETTNSG